MGLALPWSLSLQLGDAARWWGEERREGREREGEDVCCFAVREVINGVPGFASELPGSVLRSISREKSMQPHRWPHSLSIHKHAAAIHRESYARSQIPRRARACTCGRGVSTAAVVRRRGQNSHFQRGPERKNLRDGPGGVTAEDK